jgi:hypothetical protein
LRGKIFEERDGGICRQIYINEGIESGSSINDGYLI